jgi:hypothetical protein
MTIKSIWIRGLLAVLCGCAVFMACEYKGPVALWNPNQNLGASPVITSVSPPDSAGPGVSEILLNGQNFPTDTAALKVYFNNAPAIIKSTTPTQISLFRPPMVGSGITITVMVENDYQLAKLTGYAISATSKLYGNLPSKNITNGIAVDAQENVYVLTTTKNIIQVTPQAVKTTIASQGPAIASDIRIGPDGNVYIQERAKTQLYQIVLPAAAGAKGQKYAAFAKNVMSFDFDANRNIFGAGDKTGISIIAPDLTTRGLTQFQAISVKSLRVFKGYVYATDGVGIWKSAIQSSDGTLGPEESVFQIADAGAFGILGNGTQAAIQSFEMSGSGTLFVSINANGANDPILYVKPNGEIASFYRGLLPSSGGPLFWGSGNWMYMAMKTNTVVTPSINVLLRIDMGEPGAGK